MFTNFPSISAKYNMPLIWCNFHKYKLFLKYICLLKGCFNWTYMQYMSHEIATSRILEQVFCRDISFLILSNDQSFLAFIKINVNNNCILIDWFINWVWLVNLNLPSEILLSSFNYAIPLEHFQKCLTWGKIN